MLVQRNHAALPAPAPAVVKPSVATAHHERI